MLSPTRPLPIAVHCRSVSPVNAEGLVIVTFEDKGGNLYPVRLDIEAAAGLNADIEQAYGRYLLTKSQSAKSRETPSEAPSNRAEIA